MHPLETELFLQWRSFLRDRSMFIDPFFVFFQFYKNATQWKGKIDGPREPSRGRELLLSFLIKEHRGKTR